MTLRELWARLLGGLRRNDAHSGLDDEIAAHLAMAIDDNLAQGMTAREARRAALRRFGGVASAKERVHDQLGLPALDALTRDARASIRGLRRSPGFTLVAVSVLALGIGVCSAFFSILNGVLLKPAPGIADPGSLFATQQAVSLAHVERLRERRDLSAWIGQATFNVALQPGAEAERIDGHIVAPGYFRTLGVEPMLGRTLDALEKDPALGRSVFVSHDFWRTRLAADPGAEGRRLIVNGQPVTVVGVGPDPFRGVLPSSPARIFVSAAAGADLAPELDAGPLDPNARIFQLLLRPAPSESVESAQADLQGRIQDLDRELGAAAPELASERPVVQLMPAGGSQATSERVRRAGLAFYAVLIGLVLSLTCASLAGLVMARGAARAKEIAVRLSLGASRSHVVRHLLAESLLLAVAGGAAGLIAAYAMLRALARYVDGSSGNAEALLPDLRVALLTFAVSAFAAIGFGLLPALGAARPALTPALKGDASAGLPRLRRLGLRNFFVVTQVAVSLALILVVGALTLGSNRDAGRDPGFDASKIHVFSLDPRRDGFSPAESLRLAREVAAALRSAPGVEAATLAREAPLKLGVRGETITDETSQTSGAVQVRAIGPRHFETLQATVALGGDLPDRTTGPMPIVLNQTATAMLFGEQNPLGRTLRLRGQAAQVVGVVRYGTPPPFSSKTPPTAFVPLTEDALARGVKIVARTPRGLDAATIAGAVERTGARLSWYDAATLAQSLSELERTRESITALNLGMASFAFVLACAGLAGVTAQAVERRRKEIGIAIALGAGRATVMGGVMKDGAVMTLCGIVLGLCGAFALSRALIAADEQFAALLPAGAGAWGLMLGAPAALALLALVACCWPAQRAAAVDPLTALRAE